MKYLLTLEFLSNTWEYPNLSFEAVQDILKAQDIFCRHMSDQPDMHVKKIIISPDYVS